jgi:hypothetical protein
VQRDQPHPVELRVPDRDHPVAEIDVVAGERQRLAQTHAGRGKQPDQRLVGGSAQWWSQPPGRLQQ